MGSVSSKVGEQIQKEEPCKAEIPSTPILTPRIKSLQEFDPRSPSANIVRTPIQTILNQSATPNENQCDTFNINSPAPKIYGTDPRSPTIDFTRTPIILAEETKLPQKLYNKNFDNVRKTLIAVTPKKISDMPSYVPPKLLESSPLTKPNDNKRKSMVGVLETNLDCIETDLDVVIQNKLSNRDNSPRKEEMIEISINDIYEEVIEDEKTTELIENITETLPQTFIDDDGLIDSSKLLEEPITEVPKTIELVEEKTHKMNEFDKKITTLIYTDDDNETIPVKNPINLKDNNNRTPLGVRNGEQQRKIQPKLKVSDRPRKSDYAVSKIPVFNNKTKKHGLVQCENTPPRNKIMESRIGKRNNISQWDNDNTLII